MLNQISYTLPFFLFVSIVFFSSCNEKKPSENSPTANASAADSTIADPWQRLMNGNQRYIAGQAIHPNQGPERRTEIAQSQKPFAVIVTCSDSRVPPEIIFDAGLGDLFVIRTAGNIITTTGEGSIDYAVEHLGTKLIVVMGHERCGAVGAFVQGGEAEGNIATIMDSLKSEAEMQNISDDDKLDQSVRANVRHQVKNIINDALLKDEIAHGEVKVISARYDLDDGKVEMIK